MAGLKTFIVLLLKLLSITKLSVSLTCYECLRYENLNGNLYDVCSRNTSFLPTAYCGYQYIFDRSSKSVRIERRLLSQPFMTTPGQKQISVVGKCITSFESQYRIESYICNSDYCNTDCNDEVLVPAAKQYCICNDGTDRCVDGVCLSRFCVYRTVNGYVEPLRSCIKGAEVLLQDDRYQQLYINSNSGCQQSFENGVMYYTSVCNGNRCNFDCYSSTAVTPVFNISSIPTTNSALSSAELFGTSLLIAVTTAIYRLLVHI